MSGDQVKFNPLIKGDFRLIVSNVSQSELVENTLTPWEARVYIVD